MQKVILEMSKKENFKEYVPNREGYFRLTAFNPKNTLITIDRF